MKKRPIKLNKKKLEKILEKSWEEIKDRYYHPLLKSKSSIAWNSKETTELDEREVPRNSNKSKIKLGSHEVSIAEDNLQQVSRYIDPKIAIDGLHIHEIGHYCIFPKDLATVLFLHQVAAASFGKPVGEKILNLYLDVVDDSENLLSSTRSLELSEFYRAVSLYFNDMINNADINQKGEILKNTKPNRLILAYYGYLGIKNGKDKTNVYIGDIPEEKLEKLKDIDFSVKQGQDWQMEYIHSTNLITFGGLIKDLLYTTNAEDCIIDNPFEIDKGFNLEEFTTDEINEALNKLIKEHGKIRYDAIKEHIKVILGDKFIDDFVKKTDKTKIHGIGIERSNIQLNNELIAYYSRLASVYGVSIAKKPLTIDVKEPYPERCSEFSLGDPVQRLNHFSSGGKILPAITKKFEDGYGMRQDKAFSIPDLFLIIDSSGSMDNPTNMSYAVLAGFILARNYAKNGKKVGLMNFSTDALLIEPTRDIDLINSGLCAYWGGGTVLNISKIKEYFLLITEKKLPTKETDGDYEKIIEKLSPEKKKLFQDKMLNITLDTKVQGLYNRIDNVLITDGGIANLPQLVDYMNSIAKYTRNIVFLINNIADYNRWKEQALKNTQIILINKKEDLLHLAIGLAKKVVREGSFRILK